jgi:nitrate/TMAO reductase-like tetraheme cytochrome c subunit
VDRLEALVRHPLAVAGAALATASGVGFVVLLVALVAGLYTNPYAGLVVGIVLPAGLLLGLILIAVGIRLERRRVLRGQADPQWPVVDLRLPRVRRTALLIGALTTVNVIILLLGSHATLRWMESPVFCGAVCHTPMEPQYVAWGQAVHARTACVQCHIGEGPRAMVQAKLAGVRQLSHVIMGSYARPTAPGTQMPPGAQAETCVGCHVPRRVGDRLTVIREYADDEANTETTTTLQMRMSAIHSHADPAVRIEYVATDDANENIPYVRVTRADGEVREYATPEATDEVRKAGTRRTMDCVDCHNTVGHPIAASAERAVDRAMAEGAISRALPHARREGVRLVKAEYASQDEAVAAIDREFRGFYRSRGGPVDEGEVTRTVAALQALYRRNVFPSMKVTWGSYPDNRGHFTATGCFRCHDGTHADRSGAVLAADCESCHIQQAAAAE